MAFSRPVIIECISGLDAAFSEEFRTALAALGTGVPVVVELKRATVVDLPGLESIVETIRARREAGGAPTVIAAAAPRLRAMLRQCHAPEEWLVVNGGESARRRIILASAAHPVRTRAAQKSA